MASWPPSIVRPTASVGAVSFIIFILSDSGAARTGASLASSGYERAGSAYFQRISHTLLRPPPSFTWSASPPPLSGRHWQQGNPPHHRPEQPPRQVALRQEQPVIARMFD